MKAKIIVSLLVLIWASAALAITIYVPENYSTIQDAIGAATNGDSILIAPGTYAGFYVTSGPDNLTILGAGAFTANPTVLNQSPINPYHECIRVMNVEGWEIGQLTLRQIDPSGGSTFDLHFSSNIWLHHLDFAEVAPSGGTGLVLNGNNTVMVERCLFRAGNYDVLSCWYTSNSNITYENLTISGNGAGIINRAPVPNWNIRNCLVYNNDGTGFYILYYQPSYTIQYNDSWGNDGPNYAGFTPDPTNFSLDPVLVGGEGWEAYMLLPDSPCIDAGDPDAPPDPDGTVADIGCFYFNQNFTPGSLTLDLEPVNPPIILPPQGGAFDYTASLACDPSNYAIFDAWTELLLPDGQTMGPLYIRPNVFLAAGDSLFRQLEMYVSAWAMPGTYEFRGYLGPSLDSVWAADFFTFEKLPLEGGATPAEDPYVVISGWDLVEKIYLIPATSPPRSPLEISGTPNPFNPETTLRFNLPETGHATLKVYDLSGRTVATLFDRELQAGWHTAQFDGSQAASGIYLAVLESEGGRIVERLLLLK